MVLDVNVALTDKQCNGTENSQQCGSRTSASFHFLGSIPFATFSDRMTGRSLQPSHVTVQCGCTVKWTTETSQNKHLSLKRKEGTLKDAEFH